MIGVVIVTLWGLSLLGGIFLTFVWGRLAWRASKVARDQFFFVALGLCLGAIGNVLMFGARTIGALRDGIEPAFLRQPGLGGVVAGLVILAVSKSVLMWAHDTGHRSSAWRSYIALCLAWMTLAPVWMLS